MRFKITLANLLISMRPKQWVKNLFVFAALIFVKNFLEPRKIFLSLSAFVILCAASSAVYLINDIMDARYDAEHPKKKLRPIAAGALPKSAALIAACVFAVGALAWSALVNRQLAAVIAAYIVLQLLYSFWLKRMVIIDVLCIALGFVLRVIAGAVAISVPFSVWLILCTFFLALFLGISKRKNELMYGNASSRGVLRDYSIDFLNQMNAVVMPSTVIAYAFYTFSSEHSKWLMATIPIVTYGLFRYLWIMDVKRVTDDGPADDILFDSGLQMTVFVWIAVSIFILIYGK